MKSILEQFALGNISMDGSIIKGSEYERVMKNLTDCEDKLMFELNDKLKETLTQYVNAQLEAHQMAVNDKFIFGYRLGVLMTMEVFNGLDDAIFGGKD